MMNKAQREFRSRGELDSRDFTTWYDNQDVQRLIWQIYQPIPEDKKQLFAKPFVFFDGDRVNAHLGVCHQILREQNLSFMPFILKPKILPHYYAGFIHLNPDYIYIFDPVGTNIKNGKFRDGFNVSNDNKIGHLPVIVAQERIQNPNFEDGIVSCGPLCVEFLDFIMNHPEVIPTSGLPSPIMPPIFSDLMQSDATTYQESIVAVRQKHDGFLGQLSDAQLASDAFEGFTQKLTDLLLNPYEEDFVVNADSILSEKKPVFAYNTQEVQQVIRHIYQNTPLERRQHFIEPHVYGEETLDLEDALIQRQQSFNDNKPTYFPFVFKPKSSQQFCAGLVVNQPKRVYLFVPNGLIPKATPWQTYLGLSSKFDLGGSVLMTSVNYESRLPSYGSAGTLLSIEFLNYIMQHENTYRQPHQFLELLKIHCTDYPEYLHQAHQKHQACLALKSPITTKPPTLFNVNLSTEQIYLQYVSNLASVLDQAAQTAALSQAQKEALSEARTLLNVLNDLIPVSPDYQRLLPAKKSISDRNKLILASLCSHASQGVIFMTQNQQAFHTQLYKGPFGLTGSVHYDLAAHQASMQFIKDKAALLPGAGWYKLKAALLILAGALLVACSLASIVISTPLTSGVVLSLAGTAALSASVGLFVGRDTGIAAAAKQVTMQPASLTM